MPPLRAAWLLLILLLTLALAAGGVIVGSRFLAGPSTGLPAAALIPQGDAAVLAFATLGSDGRPAGDIFTIRADGTDERQLTAGPAEDSDPTWSPDGTRIAFHRWDGDAESLVVMDAGGGDLRTLMTRAATKDCTTGFWSVSWSPDGASLVFPTQEGCSGPPDLAIVPSDGSAPPARLLAHRLDSVYGTWSPGGDRIAFMGSEATGSTGLYVADVGPEGALAGGLEWKKIAADLAVNLDRAGFPAVVIPPQWSPDGQELVVTKVTKGVFLVDADGVFIVKADGSGQRLLAERAGSATWSPDGQQLAFQRTVDPSEYANDRPCTVRTFLITRDGTGERRLDDLGDGCPGRSLWSPDGTRLASVLITPQPGKDPLWQLGIVMVDGSRPALRLADGWGSWQPLAVELPAPPSFPAASSAP